MTESSGSGAGSWAGWEALSQRPGVQRSRQVPLRSMLPGLARVVDAGAVSLSGLVSYALWFALRPEGERDGAAAFESKGRLRDPRHRDVDAGQEF